MKKIVNYQIESAEEFLDLLMGKKIGGIGLPSTTQIVSDDQYVYLCGCEQFEDCEFNIDLFFEALLKRCNINHKFA